MNPGTLHASRQSFYFEYPPSDPLNLLHFPVLANDKPQLPTLILEDTSSKGFRIQLVRWVI